MLTLARLFGEHMVLQRQKNIAIWGNGEPRKKVEIQLLNTQGVKLNSGECICNDDGTFMCRLPAMEAYCNLRMIVKTKTEIISFEGVHIGEVWVAGGQSNMEYYMEHDAEKEDVLLGCMNPQVFFYDYPQVSYEGELEQYDYSEMGVWRRCTKEDIPWFSAVGYYFAVKLQEALGVPVGILGCNWGGTPACAWMSEAYLNETKGNIWLEEYLKDNEGIDEELYKRLFRSNTNNDRSHPISVPSPIMYPGLSREEQLEERRVNEAKAEMAKRTALQKERETVKPKLPSGPGPFHPWRPCGLYETMLKKIVPYTVRGIIWYQGESDEPHAEVYDSVFAALIQDWRMLWQESLPFLFVQLPPFEEWRICSGERFPLLRECQERVAKTVPKTWMCSTSDAGMRWDIHPKHKRPVGERLALLARGHVYGENILCDAPEPEEVSVETEGICIRFRYGEGLYLKSSTGDKVMAGEVNSLLINNQPCIGRIMGNKLFINASLMGVVKVSLAEMPYYEVNLYNGADIPAKPFIICISMPDDRQC